MVKIPSHYLVMTAELSEYSEYSEQELFGNDGRNCLNILTILSKRIAPLSGAIVRTF